MKIYITIDGGTTNTRVNLVKDRQIIDTRKIARGAKAGIDDKNGLKVALKDAIRDLLDSNSIQEKEVIRILASGMITSEFGLYELPHLTAPAGIKELHDSMAEVSFPEISPIPFVFVRGIKVNSDNLCDFDMMRGEETELVGINYLQENSGILKECCKNSKEDSLKSSEEEKCESSSEKCKNSPPKCEISSEKCENSPPKSENSSKICENLGRIFVLPGSHSKIVRTDSDGRVVSFSTMLTGEMLMSLSQNTILKDAVDISISEFDREHLIWGYRFALEEGLNKSLFKVRILKNAFKATPVQVYSFFVGAVLSDEIKSILDDDCHEVIIGGNHQIKEATATLIEALSDKSVTTLSDSEVAASTTIGAISIFEY